MNTSALELTTHAGTVVIEERGRPRAGRPTLLFAHGALVDGSLWAPVLPLLEDHFHCLVPTLPLGSHRPALDPDADLSKHGLARLLLEIAEQRGASRPVLVGNDSGGAICQMTAALFPERIAALVLTNCDLLEVFPPKAYAYLLWMARRPWASRLGAKVFERFPALGITLPATYGALSTHLGSEDVRRFMTPAAEDAGVRRDVAKIFRGLSAADTLDAAERLETLDLPVHLVWGANDPFFTLELARRFQAKVGATLDVIEGSRTYVSLDQPERLAACLRERFGDQRGVDDADDPVRDSGATLPVADVHAAA